MGHMDARDRTCFLAGYARQVPSVGLSLQLLNRRFGASGEPVPAEMRPWLLTILARMREREEKVKRERLKGSGD